MSIDLYGGTMDYRETIEFAESQGIDILSFGGEEGGYGIPMSFGFDSDSERCIFQFAFDDGSTKRRFIEKDRRVTLTLYEWNAVDDWRSVVFGGFLHRVPDDQQSRAAGIFAAHAKIASLEVFRQPTEELVFGWYELEIDETTGRQSR